MKKRNFRVQFYKRKDGKCEWRIKSPNGRIVATSGGQGYERMAFAVKSFEAIKAAFWEGRVR